MTEPSPADTAAAPGAAEPAARPPALTVSADALLWLGLIAAAAALRLYRLDALPLTFDESGRALDALRVSQGSVPEGWSGDLTAALTSYLFRIFDEGELLARIVPAVAGSAAVAAVWLWGGSLGRRGALAAGALLALSPLAVLFSRSAAPFSLGALLAVVMTASLLSYLAEPRAHSAFLFAVAFGLAFSTDAVATSTAIAVAAFLVLEPIASEESAVARAWGIFQRSPAHWLSVAVILAAGLELGFTRFGTVVDLAGLPGVTQWADMFSLSRDGREPEYQIALLLAYDWPVLLLGAAAWVFFGRRLLRRGAGALTPAQLMVVLWLLVAALTVALAGEREAGQMLILVLPLALASGLLVEESSAALDWAALRRWWPAPIAALALLAYAALITTQWADPEGGIGGSERFSLVLALGGAALILAGGYPLVGRRAAVIGMAVVAAVAFVFLAHADLSLVRNREAAEFAVDIRTRAGIERFREAVGQVIGRRAGPVLIDPAFNEPLGWYLRDVAVTFAPPAAEAAALVVPAGSAVEGFTPVGEPWRLGQGWYPPELDVLGLWRWLVYREPYGNLDDVDAHILVPVP